MKPQFAACLLFLIGSLAQSQITVKNPSHPEYLQQGVQLLHQVICQVIAEELHLRRTRADLPLTLVLGEPQERIGVGEDGMPSKIYLHRWDEAAFAIADMQFVIERAVLRDHWQHMTNEVLRRGSKWRQYQRQTWNRVLARFGDATV